MHRPLFNPNFDRQTKPRFNPLFNPRFNPLFSRATATTVTLALIAALAGTLLLAPPLVIGTSSPKHSMLAPR